MFRKNSKEDVYDEMLRGKLAYENRLSARAEINNLTSEIKTLNRKIEIKLYAEQTGTEARYYENNMVLGFQVITESSAELIKMRDAAQAKLDAANAKLAPVANNSGPRPN